MEKPINLSNFQEIHSDEVHEIIASPPHWLLRSGISVFFLLLMIVGLGTWYIKYPDIVKAPFTLTTVDAPRILPIRSDGKIVTLLVKDEDTVIKGQNLAYLESTADHEQVIKLLEELNVMERLVNGDEWDVLTKFKHSKFSRLGEIQNDFQIFYAQLIGLKTSLNGGFLLSKRKLLLTDQSDLKEMLVVLMAQLEIQRKDFDLAKEEFKVQEKLFQQKVISVLEYRREEAKLLNRELPVKTLMSLILQNRSLQTAKSKEFLEIDNTISEHKDSFIQSLQTLRSSLENWKIIHILASPISGRLSFSAPWQEQQHLTNGQEFGTVEPANSRYGGLVKISQLNLGKLREGQRVLLKLDGFPYKEYGMLSGSMVKISRTPGPDSSYWGAISLENKLITSYGKELAYRGGMKGIAEIVTEDRRLAERLISVFKTGNN